MGRVLDRLTSKQVENEKRLGYHADGGGLYLQVSPSHSKSWIFRYMLNGRAREMGLGARGAIGLADARKRAAECRALLLDQIDPIEARNTRRTQDALASAKTISFSECATRYIAAHRSDWKNKKHAEQWTNTLETYCGPVIGSLPVSKVDTSLVLKVLEPIWTKLPETASRLRARMENVLDWATVRGYRVGDNPALWRGHLDKLLPKLRKTSRVKHHPAIPYDQIATFFTALRAQAGIAPRALEFTILTAGRTAEVIGTKHSEIDLKKAVWTIPAERMKAGREHRVPLCQRAISIVKSQAGSEWLFPGLSENRPLSNMAMLTLLRRMKRTNLTVHGFRSTFRDWAAEQTNYPREVCEMALAHTIADKSEAAYRRGDLFEKRRKLMNDWAQFCTKLSAKPKHNARSRKR